VNHHLVLRYLIVNYWGIYCVGPAMSVGSLLYIKPLCKTLSTAADGGRRPIARAASSPCPHRFRGPISKRFTVNGTAYAPKRLLTYNDIGCEVVPLT